MMDQTDKYQKPRLYYLPFIIFFLGSFVFFGFFSTYIFFYQEKSALFIFSIDFLRENLQQPGGFLVWLGKILSTFYYYPVPGAIILSTLLTLSISVASKIINELTGITNRLVPFLIGSVLFYLQTDYRFFLFNITGLLIQLTVFLAALKCRSFLNGWMAVLFAPLIYFLTGGFALVYLLITTIYLVLSRTDHGWLRIIGLWSLMLIVFYLSAAFIFFQPGKTLITFPFSDANTGSQQILFIAVTGLIALIPLISRVRISVPEKFSSYHFLPELFTATIVILVIVITGMRRLDIKTKQYFEVEKLFFEGRFNDVIDYNTANPSSNILTIYFNNIALCEKGKLDDLLFHFPQSPDGRSLFLKWEMAAEVLNRGGYFYYTIGMINEAHRWAFENMVMKGYTSEGMKMLIKTDLINGNYEVATKYINLLKKTLFYRKEAKSFEKLLFSDAAINSDDELGKKRKNRIESDFFSITNNPYINLEIILASDSMNRNAFEYKMAYMLLKKNYKGIAHDLPRFGEFGFTRLPVHTEEAAIALAVSNKGKLPDTGNLQISKNTEERWNQYLGVLQQYGNDIKSAEPVLKRRFGDTFWYYVFYK